MNSFLRAGLGLVLAAVLVVTVTGCKSHQHGGDGHGDMSCCADMKMPTEAVAVISATPGNNVKGVVRFTQVGDKVRVVAHVEGLTPNGQHGFHVHEFGDWTVADATSAGSHFDPHGSGTHGKPTDAKRHGGDMGNLQANDKGVADLDVTLDGLGISCGSGAVLGRSVIIHAKPDDFGQPVGNAGARIGIGVIGVAKTATK